MDQSQNADTQGVAHAVEDTQASGQEEEHDVKPSIPETSQSTVVPDAEESRLRELQADVRNQDDLERDIGRQADKLLIEQADERDHKRLERTLLEKSKLESQILRLHQRLSQPVGTAVRVRTTAEIENLESRISSLDADAGQIQQRIDERHQALEEAGQVSGSGRLPNESRRDYLIRTGKITPFSKMGGGFGGSSTATLTEALIDAEDEREQELALQESASYREPSHRNLQRPGFDYDETRAESDSPDLSLSRPQKRRKRVSHAQLSAERGDEGVGVSHPSSRLSTPTSDAEYVDSGVFFGSGEESLSDEWDLASDTSRGKSRKRRPKKSRKKAAEKVAEDFEGVDDGDEMVYQSRLEDWVHRRSAARKRTPNEGDTQTADAADSTRGAIEGDSTLVEDEKEWFLPHPKVPDKVIDGGFRIPGDIYPYLFDYQKTGVQWLWELYQQKVGGIIGDEMGLGKTIQVIAFLAGLHHSKKLTKSVIVVCPPTVMKQWVNEFHRWWAPFRVSILHSSGSGMVNLRSESFADARLESQLWEPDQPRRLPKEQKAAKRILKRVLEEGHVLVTTYSGLQTYRSLLIPVDWGCAILDEGHKIRNPDTAITIHCKELRTAHRLILSGTPMQNNLTELWSLFDFAFPMRLGTLVNFRNQFEFPIRTGGYANASNLQVQTAAKCAETLKDAISPYLLQRFKIDVAADLPKKSEQVLFCKLTKLQRSAYEAFLGSNEMSSILRGRREALYGIDMLRKICNHPDLPEHKVLSKKPSYNYGSASKSGKMQVVKSLLELWRDTGHKTLLFTQHRIMLDILERFIISMGGFKYQRMDGNTPIKFRQKMVDEFNNNPDIHVFLLTTKVGGLGVNLTGADRVIIYDPDWNPSTDVQARERAWRLGQKREVTIYRLMTAGTIEEKIYHRQIFKQFLTNKILKDPKQRQTFQMSDLHDLFTLGNDGRTETETIELFKNVEVTFQESKGAQIASPEGTTNPAAEASVTGPDREEQEKISRVTGVSSLERFHEAPETPNASKTDGARAPNSEARLMEGIFARSGVHSALEHEQIINGKRVIKADPKIIEAEAKKVAAEAARELLRAGELAKSIPVGTPTWTGQFGVAGRPEDTMQPPRGTVASPLPFGRGSAIRRATGGPSSASLLANLTNRTVGDGGSGWSNSSHASGTNTPRSGSTPGGAIDGGSHLGSSGGSSSSQPRGKDFLKMIRDYIMAQGGSVRTQNLIDHFNRFCDTPRATMEFKEMLRTIAVLEKTGGRARGKWVLRPEYATGHDPTGFL
ncbi:DNA repair and recombination protein RAD26 [Histoplasma capsulatum]|uniref:DNA repair and recombination protein RAD26 n=1 Tax=Ajellomyces capsulatus TaxID=5037 RepID=A0A8A1MPS1_AJECA|nr:DNA repair and recombination protein RAD26 [Histoplasma mississippiense (nom. inval.)]EDN05048.1 DNA repair and recombination protein RAD26 [Histoplasma mississippiense (nom. inval.)]QSS66613.1 DNA repair and recombination protein RAD26 [Histoplasma capsulatum]